MSWIRVALEFDAKASSSYIRAELHDAAKDDVPRRLDVRINPFRRFDEKVFASREDAYAFVSGKDTRDYTYVVPFYSSEGIKETAKLKGLRARLAAAQTKKDDYERAHSVLSFKAEYVGCPNCASKLRKKFLSGDKCPVCRADMRSETTLNTLKRYSENIRKLNGEIRAEEDKLAAQVKKVQLLAVADVYVG